VCSALLGVYLDEAELVPNTFDEVIKTVWIDGKDDEFEDERG